MYSSIIVGYNDFLEFMLILVMRIDVGHINSHPELNF